MRVNTEGLGTANDRIDRDAKVLYNNESQGLELRLAMKLGQPPMVTASGPNFENSSMKDSIKITPFFGDG